MFELIVLLAQTVTAPPVSQGISPAMVAEIIAALFGVLGVGGVAGAGIYHKVVRVKTVITGQPIEIVNATKPVSYENHQALDARVGKVEVKVESLTEMQHRQFVDIRRAGEGRERRILETVKAGDVEIHRRLDALLPVIPSRRKMPG